VITTRAHGGGLITGKVCEICEKSMVYLRGAQYKPARLWQEVIKAKGCESYNLEKLVQVEVQMPQDIIKYGNTVDFSILIRPDRDKFAGVKFRQSITIR